MDQQPPSSPNPPTTPPPAAPNPPTPPTGPSSPMQPHSNKNLIIGVIVAAVVALLAIIAVVVAIAMSGDKSDNKNTNDNNTTQQDDDALRSANAKAANSLSDFSVVCDNGSISNATDYKAPYKVAAFSKTSISRGNSAMSLPYDADYAAKYSDYQETNAVACLEEKEGSAVKSKTCDFKSSGETVKLDYYAVKYTVTLREAKTGKLIKELGEVNGPATTCPFFVSYDKSDPKYYARPDSDAVGLAIEKFLAQQ